MHNLIQSFNQYYIMHFISLRHKLKTLQPYNEPHQQRQQQRSNNHNKRRTCLCSKSKSNSETAPIDDLSAPLTTTAKEGSAAPPTTTTAPTTIDLRGAEMTPITRTETVFTSSPSFASAVSYAPPPEPITLQSIHIRVPDPTIGAFCAALS